MTYTLTRQFTNQPEARDGRRFFLLGTPGFASEIPFGVQRKMIDIALEELTGKITWVVFCPKAEKRRKEDQGRTLVYPLSILDKECKKKVWAILDDFHAPENVGLSYVKTQFVLTLLLPEEY